MKFVSGFFSACLLLVVLNGGASMAADNPDPAVKAAADAKAIAEAERDAAKARLDKAKAEAELAAIDATTAANNAGAIAAAEKAGYDKDKAAADAKAAAIAAEQAAVKAKFGSISANSVTAGEVTAGTNAGLTEATILASRALDVLAAAAAQVVDRDVIILTGNTKPQTGNYRLYKFKHRMTTTLFQQANLASTQAETAYNDYVNRQPVVSGGQAESVGAIVTGVGAALDAASKIASFFQTTYKFDNIPVQGIDDDLFAAAVAGKIVGHAAYLPGRMTSSAGADAIFVELETIANARLSSASRQATGEARLEALQATAEKAKDAGAKRELKSLIDGTIRAIAAEKAASKAFDDFFAALSASEGGKPAIGTIIEERNVADLLGRGLSSLYLKVNMQGGGSYTRKSLWNFLGAQPFFVTGGVVANYVLTDADGKVIKSGNLAKHAGYHSVGDINY